MTLVTFPDAESQRAWREHPDHRLAQQAGRDRFYAECRIQVCECTRVRTFKAAAAPVAGGSRPDGGEPPIG